MSANNQDCDEPKKQDGDAAKNWNNNDKNQNDDGAKSKMATENTQRAFGRNIGISVSPNNQTADCLICTNLPRVTSVEKQDGQSK